METLSSGARLEQFRERHSTFYELVWLAQRPPSQTFYTRLTFYELTSTCANLSLRQPRTFNVPVAVQTTWPLGWLIKPLTGRLDFQDLFPRLASLAQRSGSWSVSHQTVLWLQSLLRLAYPIISLPLVRCIQSSHYNHYVWGKEEPGWRGKLFSEIYNCLMRQSGWH